MPKKEIPRGTKNEKFIGMRFGDYEVLDIEPPQKTMWKVKCHGCGKIEWRIAEYIRYHDVKRCRECQDAFGRKSYSKDFPRAYKEWRSLQVNLDYKAAWNEKCYQNLEEFCEDLGECPENHYLCRIVLTDDYWKGNCFWGEKFYRCQRNPSIILPADNGLEYSPSQIAELLNMALPHVYRTLKYNPDYIHVKLNPVLRKFKDVRKNITKGN